MLDWDGRASGEKRANPGDLGLTAEEEAAIVAFMKALSDGYVPQVDRE